MPGYVKENKGILFSPSLVWQLRVPGIERFCGLVESQRTGYKLEQKAEGVAKKNQNSSFQPVGHNHWKTPISDGLRN